MFFSKNEIKTRSLAGFVVPRVRFAQSRGVSGELTTEGL